MADFSSLAREAHAQRELLLQQLRRENAAREHKKRERADCSGRQRTQRHLDAEDLQRVQFDPSVVSKFAALEEVMVPVVQSAPQMVTKRRESAGRRRGAVGGTTIGEPKKSQGFARAEVCKQIGTILTIV